MRVLLVSPYPDSNQLAIGGVQAATVQLAHAMAAHGAEVRVLVLDRAGRPDAFWRDGLVTVVRRSCRQHAAAFRGFSLARNLVAIETRQFSPDVIHAQGIGPEGIAVSSQLGVPRVVTPHGDPEMDFLRNQRRRLPWESHIRKRLACRTLSECDLAVIIGAIPEYLSGCPREVVLSTNPIDEAYFRPLNRHEQGVRILVPAVIKRIKSFEIVLKAADRVAANRGPIEVRIAGPVSDSEYRVELERLAEGLPGVATTWLGHLDVEALIDEYDSATAAVLGSQWEVSPIIAAEAMARQCPVVLPDHPGPSEMLGSGSRGWLYRAGSVEELAAAIENVLDDPGLVRVKSADAFDWAVSCYAPEAVAERTMGFYAGLVADPTVHLRGMEGARD